MSDNAWSPLIHPPIKKMVWLDLETTGLDPEKNTVLEIGIVVTNEELETGLEWSKIIIPNQSYLDDMNDLVREMHTKNGLLEDLKSGVKPALWVQEAEDEAIKTLEVLFGFEGNQEKVPLCGSTISFDRSFLVKWMPRLDKYFHYRSIDVSSIKELVKYWYPELPERPKNEIHRAIPDCHESIELLKYYRDRLFKNPVDVGLEAILVDGVKVPVTI